MQQQLRVDIAAVQAMASRWGASVGELDAAVTPAWLGLSFQASATAVNAAHGDVAVFTAVLAARVGVRVTNVAEADTRYVTNETNSANEEAAVAQPVIGV